MDPDKVAAARAARSTGPRALADMPGVDALRKLRDAGIPALLYGPPGTGMTSLPDARERLRAFLEKRKPAWRRGRL